MDGPGGRLQTREDTVSKSKNTDKTTTVAADFVFGADPFKTGFEKGAKFFETAGEFNKDNLEAYITSATVVGSGLQSLAQDSSDYAKKAIEDAVAVSKAIAGTKSIQEALELQTSYAKTAFAGYVSQLTQINQAFATTAKEGFAPLQARAEAARQLMPVAQA